MVIEVHQDRNPTFEPQVSQGVTTELANKVGYELAMRFTKGKYAFIVATHVAQAHVHNHIQFNLSGLYQKVQRGFWFW